MKKILNVLFPLAPSIFAIIYAYTANKTMRIILLGLIGLSMIALVVDTIILMKKVKQERILQRK